MVSLFDFSEELNLTIKKEDLISFVDTCLSKYEERRSQQYPAHLSIKQLSEYLNYSEAAIYKMVAQFEIPYYKLSGKLLFKKSEIDEWLIGFKQPTIKDRISKLESRGK